SGPVADSPHRGCNLRTLYPAGPPCPTRTQGRPAPKIRRQQVQETQCHRTRLRPPEAMARTGHQVRQARYRLQSRRRSQRQRCLATTFIRHALVTFLTMAYIVVLNPIILSGAKDVTGHYLGGGTESANFAGIAAVTALVAGIMTIAMGVIANYPLALAAGLGLNAFVGYSLIHEMSWADAMGLIVIEGLIILVLVLTGFRQAVFDTVPRQIKTAIAVGIGLFIAFVGLVDAGFIRSTGQDSPPIGMGIGGNLAGWPVLVFCVGFLLMMILYARKIPGAILIGIVATTILAAIVNRFASPGASMENGKPNPTGWNLNIPAWPDKVFSLPDLEILGNFSLLGSFERVGVVTAGLFIFTLLLADFFDTMGTMTAIGAEAAGGAASVSSNTSFIESASGVGDGARTGLSSVVTGLLFLLAVFFTPLVEHIPNEAAVPALVLVGFLMMQQVTDIDWADIE